MSYSSSNNNNNNNSSSRWGQWGSKLQGWSSQLFGDDLAEELQPMRAAPPPAPVPTTPEELQQAMKELMGHPTLWAQYKQRLAQQENPTQPETVRSVLVSFLQEHPLPSQMAKQSSAVRHAPPAHPHPPHFPPSQSQPQQSKRPSRPSMTWNMGFSEESTHVSSSISLFSKSEHPPASAPSPAAAAAPLPHATSHSAMPTSTSTYSSTTKRASSLFALNTNLLGESMHFTTDPSELQQQQQPEEKQQQPPTTPSTTTRRPSSSSPSMEQNLRLLRSAPELYTQYQERLLEDESAMDTPAADVLTQFLLDHQSELKALFQDEEERKRHEAALLHLEEIATLAEEQSQRAIRLLPGTSNTSATTTVTASGDGPTLGGSEHQELPASARTVWMDLSERQEKETGPSTSNAMDGPLDRSLGGASSSWLAWNSNPTSSATAATPQKPPLEQYHHHQQQQQQQQHHKLENSFREGWRTVSTFVAQGMESMNLELHPEDLVENNDDEDADPPSEQDVMQFSDDVAMDDPVLQQAAEIAKRRRGELGNVAAATEEEDGTKEIESVAPHHAHLEAIEDVDEDTIDVSEHVKGALNDPMMQVTMHNDTIEEPEVPQVSEQPEPINQLPTTSTEDEQVEKPTDGENEESETKEVLPPASAHSAGGVDHLL